METNTTTIRTLAERRQVVAYTIQSLETAQIASDSPAVQQALADQRAEYKRLGRQIAKGFRLLNANRARQEQS